MRACFGLEGRGTQLRSSPEQTSAQPPPSAPPNPTSSLTLALHCPTCLPTPPVRFRAFLTFFFFLQICPYANAMTATIGRALARPAALIAWQLRGINTAFLTVTLGQALPVSHVAAKTAVPVKSGVGTATVCCCPFLSQGLLKGSPLPVGKLRAVVGGDGFGQGLMVVDGWFSDGCVDG